jgi:hypothetical protein
MRDYIFRGKRKDNGKWVTGLYYIGVFGDYFIQVTDSDLKYVYEVVGASVGLYIGLKDKAGKMIFEGDNLKRTQQIDGNFIDRLFERYEVAYNSSIAGFEYKPIDGKEYKQYTVRPFGGEEIEIIGNIHEVNQPTGGALNMNIDPNVKQAEQEAAAEVADTESEAQDQAMEATQDSEEGTTQG